MPKINANSAWNANSEIPCHIFSLSRKNSHTKRVPPNRVKYQAYFFQSYGVNLPSSLTTLLPLALEFSSCPPVSVCGTGICFYTHSFSRLDLSVLPYSNFGPLRPGLPTPGSHPFQVSLCLNYRWLRNINRMCIGYAFRPDLSSRLTQTARGAYPFSR